MRVYDTLQRRLLPIPLSETKSGRPELKLYVCGVTPYDSGHLGHAFTFCAFDVLVRWLEACGVVVRYVQNVTDVDDPLFARARRDGVDWSQLAQRETESYIGQMEALGWRPPDVMPKVSDEIPGIVAAVGSLLENGYAYLSDACYFEVERYPSYGALSHRSRRSMIRKLRDEGLLGEVGPRRKRNPLDFPLWRSSEPGEPAWASAAGPGRPGWHIECSAMSTRYLGPQIDVHGGGRDLIFSHHESERAQSESLTGTVPFARAWLHTGMVRFDGRKMSKSLGNLVVVEDTLERVSAAAVRLYLASHRYQRDWSFRWEGLADAARLAGRLAELIGPNPGGGGGGGAGPQGEESALAAGAQRQLVDDFAAALDNDLDTPAAVRVLRRAVRRHDVPAASWMAGILCGTARLS
ncbi:MAG: cysteine--tRNA ligase [Candidatus Dormiibacter spiritus]|nr:MAG: cysteine--tRNA ligase [Candidatus Dormibacteraeota bacterium]